MRRLAHLSAFRLSLLATLALALAYLPLSRMPFVRLLEGELLDLRHQLQPTPPVSDRIVLVVIDEASIREVGRWPWSRSVLADVVTRLAAARPRVLGLDLLFVEPERAALPASRLDALQRALRRLAAGRAALDANEIDRLLGRFLRSAAGDPDLARAMRDAGTVVVPFSFALDAAAGPLPPDEPEYLLASAYRLITGPKAGGDGAGPPAASAVLPPIAVIGEAAGGLGHANVGLDAGGNARFEYPVVAYGANYYPSFALEVARRYLGLARDRVRVDLGRGVQLGEVFVPTDRAMRLVVNYPRPERFRRVPAADVLRGAVPHAWLRDRAVLLGGAAAGVGGTLVSPFTPLMLATERHAAVLDNILTRDFLVRREEGAALSLLLVIASGLMIALVAQRSRPAGTTAVFLVLQGGLIGANLIAFLRFGVWLDLLLPALALLLIYGGAMIHRYLMGLHQERTLRRAFEHYLSPAVVDRVVKDPALLRLGGEEKELTVFFADLRDSTRIANGMAPAAFVELLNDAMAAMTRTVFRHDGMLDKFTGDGVVVVFGAPVARVDHAELACRAALAMLDEFKALRERWARPGLPPLDLGIGINTGRMIIGNMGSGERFNYTVIGDEANLGARLEAANKDYGTRVLISEATWQKVGGKIAARELDVIRFRGIERPVRVYEVLGLEPLPEREARRAQAFAAGLEAFRADAWARAQAYFAEAIALAPDDRPARIYLERCRERLGRLSQPAAGLTT